MFTKEENTVIDSRGKRLQSWLFLRVLLAFERGVYSLLYYLTLMESDEVFASDGAGFRKQLSSRSPSEFKTLTSADSRDRSRPFSVSNLPSGASNKPTSPSSHNPVKDFIANFVNRRGAKRRAGFKTLRDDRKCDWWISSRPKHWKRTLIPPLSFTKSNLVWLLWRVYLGTFQTVCAM